MSNSYQSNVNAYLSILGSTYPYVPGAIANDLASFNTAGQIQDSGYSVFAGALTSSTTTVPTSNAVLSAIGSAVTSSKSFRGGYDASSNLFPSTGGSGAAGAILSGDVWNITVNGTLGGEAVVVGNTILALVDTPGQTPSNWLISNTLTDVIITSPLTSQYVRYNGSAWVNSAIQAGDLPLATNIAAGAVSTTTQTFAGDKTFLNLINSSSFFPNSTSTPSSGGTITLTKDSNQIQLITGTLTETYILPNATTLNNGAYFIFNNNSSGGSTTVNASGGGLVVTVARGAWIEVILLDNSTAAGTWDYHAYLPSGAIFGNTGLTFSGGTVSFANGNFSATTNQVTLGVNAHQTIINAPAPSGASVTFTIPNAAATNSIQPLGSATASNWVHYIGSDGAQHLSQPAYSDLGGSVPTWNQNTTGTAANIASGTNNQLLYQSAADTTAKLAVNSTATVQALTQVSSGAPTWTTLSNSNLSDYATGAIPVTDTSGAGLSLTAVAEYVRNGNVVSCWMRVTYPSTVDSSVAQLGGLPYTIFNTTANRAGGWYTSTGANIPTATSLVAQLNSTNFKLQTPANTANQLNSALSGLTLNIYFSYLLS